MDKRIKMSMGVGASSLIMIFVILAAVTLATLALGTAHADYKLAQKSADAAKQFYEADSKAEKVLADISQILSTAKKEVWQKELSKIPELKVIDEKGNLDISYQVPVNAKQTLNVVLETVKEADKNQLNYKIKAFQVESNNEWNYEEEGLGFEEIIIGK